MKTTKAEIRYTGFKDLKPSNQMYLQDHASKAHTKIQRMLKKTTALRVYIKTHENEGKRKKYVISVITATQGRNYRAEDFGYHFPKVVKKVFDNLEFEIKHKTHADEQKKGKDQMRRRKPYTKSGKY